MKKYLLIMATTAIFASCSNTDSFKEVVPQDDAIGFATFTSKQTRAENSTGTALNALSTYQTSFEVWGYKHVIRNTASTLERVFNAQDVNYNNADWAYTPMRFWDKQASGYDFYAAAPKDKGWLMSDGGNTFNNTTSSFKISLPSFELDGVGVAVTENSLAQTVSTTQIMGTQDLMISEDVTGYATYSATPVTLNFIHILSRLNIGVKKDAILDDYVVKLKSIKVYNLKKNGQFDEARVATPSATCERWFDLESGQKIFNLASNGIGFSSTSDGAVINTTNGIVYQGLIIPQYANYQTVDLNGQARTETRKYYDYTEYNYVNGTSLTSDQYSELADANKQKPVATAANDEAAPYFIINYTITPNTSGATSEEYTAYYNLAAAFGKNLSTQTGEGTQESPYINRIGFNEGWMYTLNLTINPVAIDFDAKVYEWAVGDPDSDNDVDVK